MTTAVDTNVLVAILKRGDLLTQPAVEGLQNAFASGNLVICGAVFGELMAAPALTLQHLQGFLAETRIDVDWLTNESVWRSAGHAFSRYAARRRKAAAGYPRRILTDFIIGAHAYENNYSLLTLDDKIFRSAFPKLKLLTI